MKQGYIFSGFGHATGKYRITNEDLGHAVKNGFLHGIMEDKIMASKSYKAFLEKHPGVSPFDYFAEHKMGFRTRHHVVPFPPSRKLTLDPETSLDLAVRATEEALKNSGVHPGDIDAWFFSTVSPHEQAPGIAATVKCFFVPFGNITPAFTLSSGCSGFVMNLERAMEYLEVNPEKKHVVVGHTETMSGFLTRLNHYVPFVTFGDAAGVVVLSKIESGSREGVISIRNYQDMKMIDTVGVDKEWNLYMTDTMVKDRATENIVKISREMLEKTGWKTEDIDMIVPHQTGHAILHESASILNVPLSKMYQEVQQSYGNVSGSSIPLSLYYLFAENRLQPGMKLLAPTAGVGGTFGAFCYIVPEKPKKMPLPDETSDLKGKTALITGSTGGLGSEVALSLAKRGCSLLLHYNNNETKAQLLEKQTTAYGVPVKLIKSDFSQPDEVTRFMDFVLSENKKIDFLIHTTAVTGSLSKASEVSFEEVQTVATVNHFVPVEITKKLKGIVSGVILYVGSMAEDAQFAGSSAYVQAKRGLHGFAASFSWEAYSAGIRSIYYMPGLIDGGMGDTLDEKQKTSAMLSVGQEKILSPSDVSERIAKSLYLPKILGVKDSYEGIMVVRRDGYQMK